MSTERDQLYFDLFVTALEGGIQYWASVLAYRWRLPRVEGADPAAERGEDLNGFRAIVVDADDSGDRHTIDRAVIARGFNLAKARDGEVGKRFRTADRDPEDSDFDADDADLVVQLGLFGEVVYG